MKPLLTALAALLVMGALSGPSQARSDLSDSQTRQFHGWTVVCNNVGDCVAYTQGEDFGPGWVQIRMDAGPEAQLQILFGEWPDEGAVPTAVRIDGQPLRIAVVTPDRLYARAIDPRAALDAMAQGQRLVLTLPGAEADPRGAGVSLAGVSATLLWMDERQGRLNTTTALIRRGTRPASAVPPARPAASVRAGPAISQTGLPTTLPGALEDLPAVQACDEETSFHQSDSLVRREVARLSDDTLLWSVLCSMGAYNQGNRFFLTDADGTHPRPLQLPQTRQRWDEELTEADRLTYINAGYDPGSRTLTTFAKARGLGDCGLIATWVWTGEAFVLAEERVMNVCAGMTFDLWPVTWFSDD